MIAPLACSLVQQEQPVRVCGGLASQLYGADVSIEKFYCSYGIAGEYVPALERGGLRVTGVDDDGEPRIVELPSQRFFVATLFLPQMREQHPLVEGFLAAAAASRT